MRQVLLIIAALAVVNGAYAQGPTKKHTAVKPAHAAAKHGTKKAPTKAKHAKAAGKSKKPVSKVGKPDGEKTAVKGVAAIQGLFKAVAFDNKTQVPGIDTKFKFNPDHTFTFTQKTMKSTIITHGTYTLEENLIELSPATTGANWPEFWGPTVELTINSNGELVNKDVTYLPSLIGKEFAPGMYRCELNPSLHYYFDPLGGYKYTGMGSMSTGEYWVTKDKDAVYLVLNILRIDGKRVNFHQKLNIGVDGTFSQEGKYTYHHVGASAPVKTETTTTTVTTKVDPPTMKPVTTQSTTVTTTTVTPTQTKTAIPTPGIAPTETPKPPTGG